MTLPQAIPTTTASARQMTQRIVTLALPMALNQFINTASGFLCMTMLAKLGPTILAASALFLPTQMALVVSVMSFLYSIGILVSHAFGAQDYLKAGNMLQQGWTLAIFLAIPVIFIFWHIGKILVWFGQAPEIAAIVQQYFHAYVFAVIPILLGVANMQFGYAVRKRLLIVSTSVVSMIILIACAYIFIFGKLGFPAFGVAGLGYAITLQALFFFCFTTWFFSHEKSFAPFEIFRYRVHQHLAYFREMFKVSWPISLQMSGELISLFVSTAMVGWINDISLSAYQVVNQYVFLVVIPIFSLSQASGILVGHSCGAKQFHEVRKLGLVSIWLVLLLTALVGTLFLVAPSFLARAYVDVNNPANAALLQLIGVVFSVVAFSQVLDGVRNVSIGMLRGLLDTRFPMYTVLVTIWLIGMPLSYVFAFKVEYGVVGVAMGGLVGMLVGAAITLQRWRKLSQRYA